MAVFDFFPFLTLLILLHNHSLLTTALPNDQNGTSIANSTTTPPPPPPPPPPFSSAAFKPGIAAIVGVLTTVFSITFLLLLYVKHCKRSAYAGNSSRGYPYPPFPARRNSGIDRKVIESLPMFRFSSLRGQKDGLECAVCLNKFDAAEVLRLLPKCKHAFHVECVDTWLEAHSTCPLCRYRVHPEDVLLIDIHSVQLTPRTSDNGGVASASAAARISGRHSSAGERGSALEIIAENQNRSRRDDFLGGRVSLDSWNSKRKTRNVDEAVVNSSSRLLDSWRSSRKMSCGVKEGGAVADRRSRKDGQLPVQGDRHRLEHRIIIGEASEEGVRRWSDVQAAELLYLGSEMLLGGGEEGRRSGSGVINERSVSEITGMSRYRSNNGGKEERERQEEGAVKRWLAWVSQSQSQSQSQLQQNPAVQSAISAAPPPPPPPPTVV